jgi:hypothetical protein
MQVSIWLGLVTATVISAAGVAIAQTAARKPVAANASVADTLMANEHKIIEALTKKDVATLNALLMSDSWSVDEMGYTKTGELLKGLAALKIDSVKTSDMKVLPMSPTVSLVTYKMDQKGTFQGQPFPPVVYATTVWVDHGGTWQAAFHQESTAAPLKK